VQLLSGVYQGHTLGTPIALVVHNHDAQPSDYAPLHQAWRPSHADFTYEAKYGLRFPSGGGRASARETLARVAAGAIAKKILQRAGISLVAYVARVGTVGLPAQWLQALLDGRGAQPTPAATLLVSPQALMQQVQASPVRCPCPEVAAQMQAAIHQAQSAGDSLGGLIVGCAYGVPAGLGEPVFDKLEADLAKALMSIPATKSFELGSGLDGTYLHGSAHNDAFVSGGTPGAAPLPAGTATNRSGGIQGGISNGEPIWVRVGFKPTATLAQPQATAGRNGTPTVLSLAGRHDPCVLPRAVPIVEAMMALVLADHHLRHRALAG
jgi:chorismate synthase